MSNLLEFIKAVNHDISAPKNKFVYYNEETGEIIKISNKKESLKHEMIEVDEYQISEIISGDKPLSKFRVEYNLELRHNALTEIFTNTNSIKIADKFYQIPKTIKDSYDLKIIQHIKNKEWIIQLNTSLINLRGARSLRDKKMRFSITYKNDPNILYRNFTLSLNELLEDMSLYYAFESNEEAEEVSIYTPKYFKLYRHEVINE